MDAAQLLILINAVDNASPAIKQVESSASSLGSTLEKVTQNTLGFAAGIAAVAGIGSVMDAVGGVVVGFNSKLEQSTISWKTFTGSVDAANAVLVQEQQIAANTQFQFTDVDNAAKRFVNAGFAAQQALDFIKPLSNAVASVGLGAEGVDRVSLALAQMTSKTKVQGDEMLQLTEAQIPAWQILADATGKPIPELQKLVTAGQISAKEFTDAFASFYGDTGKFATAAHDQSLTLQGSLSTISDELNIVGSTAFKPLFDALSNGARALAAFVQSDQFTVWGARIQAVVGLVVDGLGGLAGAFTDTLGGVLNIVNTVGQAIYQGLQWLNPFATHSPALVSQVTDGVAKINSEYESLSGLTTTFTGLGTAFEDLSGKTSAFSDSVDGLSIKTEKALAVMGPGVTAAFNEASDAVEMAKVSLGDIKEAWDSASDALAPLKDNLGATKDALQAQQDTLGDLKLSLSDAKAAFDPLNDALKAAKQNASDAESAIKSLTSVPVAGTADFDKKISDANIALKQQALELSNVKNSSGYQGLSDQIDAATAKLKEMQRTQAALPNVVAGQSAAQRAAATEASNTARAAISQQQAAIDALKAKQSDLVAPAQKKLDLDHNTLDTINLQKDATIGVANEQIKQSALAAQGIKEQTQAQIQAGIAAAGAAKSAADVQVDKLTPQVKAQQAVVDGLTAKILDQQHAVDAAQKATDAANKTYSDAKEKVDDLGTAYRDTKQQVAAYEQQLKSTIAVGDTQVQKVAAAAAAAKKAAKDAGTGPAAPKTDVLAGLDIAGSMAKIKDFTDSVARFRSQVESALSPVSTAFARVQTSLGTFTNALTAGRTVLTGLGVDFGKITSYVEPVQRAVIAFGAVLVGLVVGLQAWAIAADILSPALGAIAAALGFLLTPLGLVALAVTGLVLAFTQDLGGIRTSTEAAIAPILPILSNLGLVAQKLLAGDLPGAFDTFKATMSALGPALGTAVGSIATNVLRAAATAVTQIGTTLGGWTTAFVAWVTPALPGIKTALQLFIDGIGAWITANAPKVGTQLVAWGTALVSWVSPAVQPMLNALGELKDGLWNWITEWTPKIGDKFLEWAGVVAGWIGPAVKPMLDGLGQIIEALTGWIGEQAKKISDKLPAWGAAFADFIGPHIQPMLDSVGVAKDRLIEWIGNQAEPLKDKVAGWATALSSWAVAVWPKLREQLGKLGGQLASWISGAGAVVAGLAVTIRDQLGKVDWSGVWDEAAGLGTGLGKKLSEIDWGKVGKTLGVGLGSAIKLALDGIETTVNIGAKLFELLGKALADVDWAAVGASVTPKVLAFVLGMVGALLDPGVWIPVIAQHWDILLGIVLTFMFAPGKIVGPLTGLLSKIPFAGTFLKTIAEALTGVGKSITTLLATELSRAGGGLVDAFFGGFIRQFSGPGLAEILSQIRLFGTDLRAGFRFLWDDVLQEGFLLAERLGIGLANWVKGSASLLSGMGGDIIAGLVAGLTSSAVAIEIGIAALVATLIDTTKKLLGIASPSTVFAEIGASIVEGLLDGVTTKLTDLTDWFATTFGPGGTIVRAIPDAGKLLMSVGSDMLQGVRDGLDSFWTASGGLWEWLNGLPGQIFSTLADMKPGLALVSIGTDLLSGLKDGLDGFWTASGGLFEWLNGLLDKILSTLADLKPTETLLSIGTDLMSGLLTGLKSGWADVQDWFSNLKWPDLPSISMPSFGGGGSPSASGGGQPMSMPDTSGAAAIATGPAASSATGAAARVSQFSDKAMSYDEAAAICGPAAAVAFANVNGMYPTLAQATAIAAKTGWTQATGMAGAPSELALLQSMGLTGTLTANPTPAQVSAAAGAGSGAILSTSAHYFTASGSDTNALNVGTSGTDLIGGASTMSLGAIGAWHGGGGVTAMISDIHKIAASIPSSDASSNLDIPDIDINHLQHGVMMPANQSATKLASSTSAMLKTVGRDAQTFAVQFNRSLISTDDTSASVLSMDIPKSAQDTTDALSGIGDSSSGAFTSTILDVQQFADQAGVSIDAANAVFMDHGKIAQAVFGTQLPAAADLADQSVEDFAGKLGISWDDARSILTAGGAVADTVMGKQVPGAVQATVNAVGKAGNPALWDMIRSNATDTGRDLSKYLKDIGAPAIDLATASLSDLLKASGLSLPQVQKEAGAAGKDIRAWLLTVGVPAANALRDSLGAGTDGLTTAAAGLKKPVDDATGAVGGLKKPADDAAGAVDAFGSKAGAAGTLMATQFSAVLQQLVDRKNANNIFVLIDAVQTLTDKIGALHSTSIDITTNYKTTGSPSGASSSGSSGGSSSSSDSGGSGPGGVNDQARQDAANAAERAAAAQSAGNAAVRNISGSSPPISQSAGDASFQASLNAIKQLTGGRAAGGPVHAGRSYLVGELGPELITPGHSGTVHTATATAGIAQALSSQWPGKWGMDPAMLATVTRAVQALGRALSAIPHSIPIALATSTTGVGDLQRVTAQIDGLPASLDIPVSVDAGQSMATVQHLRDTFRAVPRSVHSMLSVDAASGLRTVNQVATAMRGVPSSKQVAVHIQTLGGQQLQALSANRAPAAQTGSGTLAVSAIQQHVARPTSGGSQPSSAGHAIDYDRLGTAVAKALQQHPPRIAVEDVRSSLIRIGGRNGGSAGMA